MVFNDEPVTDGEPVIPAVFGEIELGAGDRREDFSADFAGDLNRDARFSRVGVPLFEYTWGTLGDIE